MGIKKEILFKIKKTINNKKKTLNKTLTSLKRRYGYNIYDLIASYESNVSPFM